MRALYSLIALALAASAHADPQLTLWFATGSEKYARQYTTAANRTAGTTATT